MSLNLGTQDGSPNPPGVAGRDSIQLPLISPVEEYQESTHPPGKSKELNIERYFKTGDHFTPFSQVLRKKHDRIILLPHNDQTSGT